MNIKNIFVVGILALTVIAWAVTSGQNEENSKELNTQLHEQIRDICLNRDISNQYFRSFHNFILP